MITNTIPETHQIYVLDDDSIDILKKDKIYAIEKIKELITYYQNVHKEHINIITKSIIRSLWKEFNETYER